ncbi:MAG: hypothetical protein A2Z49_12055 [Chloroflexi bacterium RBG_19FT_COMBO_56_12]|nr:MAG: hypothetical protein A2Z49_12055 [Chloroflexi bacterium RBG_19FT_COMBO_56_12]
MNNGPALVIRGAIIGCVVVYLLVSLIQGSSTFEALAAAEQSAAIAVDSNNGSSLPTAPPATEPPAAVATDPNSGSGSSSDLSVAEIPAVEQPTPETVNQKKGKRQKAEANQSKNSDCNLSSTYPDSIQQWCDLISEAAEQYDLPADLLAALILQESGGQALAYSSSGAVGLMQVMPRDGIAAEFQCPNGPCFASRPTIAELQDPIFNIDYGTSFLAGLVEKYGSLREALYAYGPMSVGYSYADKVLGIYEAYGGE